MMIQFVDAKFVLVSVVFVAIYIYLKFFSYNYWKKNKIPHESPSVPFGNIPFTYFFASIPLGVLVKKCYEKFCHHPFFGMYVFHRPVIVINDPELIRTILVKEFSKFQNRGWLTDKKVDPMIAFSFLQSYEDWKNVRKIFSPTFSPSKLKQIHPLMSEVSDAMIRVCDNELKNSDVLEMKEIISRYASDIISYTVYGYNYNSLENPNNDFHRLGKRALKLGRINMLMTIFWPEIPQLMSISLFPKEISNFFGRIFTETVNYRRNEKIVRKDFLNLLMHLMDDNNVQDNKTSTDDKKKDDDHLSLEDAAAQAFSFFLAGLETTTSVVTICLFELALNPEIQKKLQQEIDNKFVANHLDGLTYDCVSEMKYLDMVFNETLRKHPPFVLLNRICNENFLIPGSNFTIPKGMRVLITPPGIHNNPEYYPNPCVFDPTRFTKENSASRHPYVHLGFGEGPRNCLGQRFGTMQAKQALVALLRNYTFRISDKTELPIKWNTERFILWPANGMNLCIEKRH